MEIFEKIIGHEKIINHFNKWPSFVDAEIISIEFNTKHIFEKPGPSIVAKLNVKTQINDKPDISIRFEFDNIEDIEFEGFNYQNVIEALHFSECLDMNNKECLIIHFESAFGLDLKFRCRMIIVELE